MTDGIDIPESAADGSASSATGTENNHNQPLDIKEEIVNFLSGNEKIIFKSQQIDDPDLTVDEKKSIAFGIFDESHSKFLFRFGRYLKKEHLNFFDINSYTEEEEYDIKYLLKDLRKELVNKEKNIKNRRYAAIKTMIKEDDYFSEREMMRREPHLYEELVGQYLTQNEKRVRDGYDPKNTLFSQIMFDNMDKERTENLRKEQERNDLSETTSQSSYKSSKSNNTMDEDLFPKTPPSYRKQWGNFDDEAVSCSIDRPKKEKHQKYITAGEREMLRQEFIGIMHEKFLEGMDKDFDYSKVDDNPNLDDLSQIDQDSEDKYFDDDDDEADPKCRMINMDFDDGSNDELDTYMKHLEDSQLYKTTQNVMNFYK